MLIHRTTNVQRKVIDKCPNSAVFDDSVLNILLLDAMYTFRQMAVLFWKRIYVNREIGLASGVVHLRRRTLLMEEML